MDNLVAAVPVLVTISCATCRRLVMVRPPQVRCDDCEEVHVAIGNGDLTIEDLFNYPNGDDDRA